MKKNSLIQTLKFLAKNLKYLRAVRQLEEIRMTLVLANIELGKLSYRDSLYTQRVQDFNQAMIELSKGKWFASRAGESRSKADWERAFRSIRRGKKIAQGLHQSLQKGSASRIPYQKTSLTTHGTEIQFADGAPLLPEICPIVVLKGSDYEMGRQYAQQVIQIFGAWIFQHKAGIRLSEEEKACLGKWEQQIAIYAPEILQMCRGWADGAAEAGIPLSYEDVLDIWTGHVPPAQNYMGFGEGLPARLPELACSGAAAWGRATKDGRLVTGSSGDHDCTPMVTIVAFPETGNSFIYTPFSVTGEVREIGPVYMMGHPGMNNKGLVYVEHGGGPKMVEPQSCWGYGLRLGTAVFHILRFASSAKEAQEMELSFPVGDAGRPMSYVGGFWADSSYGYAIESRKDPVIIRESGVMGETDFLYANNSLMHPDSRVAGWMQKDPENWRWDVHGGWYPARFLTLTMANIFKKSLDDRITSGLSFAYENSRGRNVYLFEELSQAAGKIDLETMKRIYRKSGALPPGTWKEIKSAYNRTGQWGSYSTGQATNACVAVTCPDNGNQGIYALCIGTAARGLTPNTPVRATPIYAETNAFWELKLAASPEEVAACARQTAQEYLELACQEFGKLERSSPAYEALQEFLVQSQEELQSGGMAERTAVMAAGNPSLYSWAKAIRAYTRAQIRALQVYQALLPPPCQ
jgi:hypothetical protein